MVTNSSNENEYQEIYKRNEPTCISPYSSSQPLTSGVSIKCGRVPSGSSTDSSQHGIPLIRRARVFIGRRRSFHHLCKNSFEGSKEYDGARPPAGMGRAK